MLQGLGQAAAAGIGGKLGMFLNNPIIKKLGELGVHSAAGVGVDYTSKQSEGENLSGTLKKNWPQTYSWIPDSIATLDSDSPDIKRNKNINEGLGLGIFSSTVEGLALLARNRAGVKNATKWIPESEKAEAFFKKNKPKQINTPEEAIIDGLQKSSDDLDSAGEYNFSKNQNLDEPTFGVHDLYGYEEVGMRTADDMGIIGASVDQARIANNLDTTYGRLGSVMSEPALKFALEGVEEYDTLMRGLRTQLSDAGEYGYRLNSGKYINSKTVRAAGDDLAESMGYMSNKEMQRQIDSFKVGVNPDTGAPMMSSEGMTAVKVRLKKEMQEYAEAARSDALVRTSLAGQVSDMASGFRYSEGSAAQLRSTEQILDRIQMLMVAQGEVGKERGLLLNLMNVFKRGGKAPTPAELKKKGADVTKQLMAEAQSFRDSLKDIAEQQPEMLGPVLLAYENLDGNVKGMDALNNYFRQSTAVISKAFIDRQPEIPSLVLQGFWSTVYNNVLSAIGTPIRAAMSSGALLVQRPMATFVGAIGQPGMMRQMRRGWYQYAALMETMNKGRKYFGETMRRSGADPTYQGVPGRENFIRNNEKQLEVLNAFADAKAAQGEYGPQAMMAQIEDIEGSSTVSIHAYGYKTNASY